jgi:protein-tyrosine-phosphatase
MVRANIRDRTTLFLCEDNACLSLIAEAIGKRLLPPKTQIFSAGLAPQKDRFENRGGDAEARNRHCHW